MLGDYPMHVVLLSLDLAETRALYHDQLGLEILNESDDAITFRSGSTELAAGMKTADGVADLGFARAAWIVDPHGNALGILQLK